MRSASPAPQLAVVDHLGDHVLDHDEQALGAGPAVREGGAAGEHELAAVDQLPGPFGEERAPVGGRALGERVAGRAGLDEVGVDAARHGHRHAAEPVQGDRAPAEVQAPVGEERAVERAADDVGVDAVGQVARRALQQREERAEVVLGQVGVGDLDRQRRVAGPQPVDGHGERGHLVRAARAAEVADEDRRRAVGQRHGGRRRGEVRVGRGRRGALGPGVVAVEAAAQHHALPRRGDLGHSGRR